MRLGIFGGTFDPVHIGHLVGALSARQALSLDRVLLMVAPSPWQKVDQRVLAPAELRFEMVRAAIDGVAGLEASRLEIDRGGLTYTIDTLHHLRDAYPTAELFLIGGTDTASRLDTWREPEQIAALADFVVLARSGVDAPRFASCWRVHQVEMPALEVSSSDLRQRIKTGLPVDFLIPPAALDLVRAEHLYSGIQD